MSTEGARATAGPPAPLVVPPGPGAGRRMDVFASRPFRLLWINAFGFALVQATQRFTYVWLVLDLGGGDAAAGLISFFLGVPVLLLVLPAGVLSDRYDRRRLLVASQVGAMLVSAATAAAIWTDTISLPVAYGLAVAAGATLAFGIPVRQAAVPSVVRPERLMNAIALMALGMNVSLVAGPAIGGGVISAAGLGGAFAAQAGVYAVTLLALAGLRLPAVAQDRRRRPVAELAEGLRFIAGHRGILTLVGLLAASGVFMLAPFFALIPSHARDRLGQDALGASMLLTSVGAGMLVTSLVLSGLPHLANKGRVFTVNLIAGGGFLTAIALSRSYALTLAIMFAWGLGGGIFVNVNQTLIQSHTPTALMGRVMSVHTLAFQGLMPLGALLAGAGAAVIGASAYMAIAGAVVAGLAVVAVFTTPSLRGMS